MAAILQPSDLGLADLEQNLAGLLLTMTEPID